MTETVLLLRDSADSTDAGDGGGTMNEDADASTVSGRLLRPPPGRFRRALPLVAALAAAAVVALLVWTPAADLILRGRAPGEVALLTGPLPDTDPALGEALAEFDFHGWPVFRGEAVPLTAEHAATFQLGVRVAELQTALSSGQREIAVPLTYRIEDLLDGLDVLHPIHYYTGADSIRNGLEARAPSTELLDLNSRADSDLAPGPRDDDPGFVDGTFYTLGKWAGAAQLAVAAGRLDWFDEPGPRRALRQLRRAELPTDVAEPFFTITAILDAGPAEADLPRLREAFETLIRCAGGGRDPEPDPGP
jgi:hypothetical protein